MQQSPIENDLSLIAFSKIFSCTTCGTVVGEMVLTEEVGFGETSSGAVVADGMRISAGASKSYEQDLSRVVSSN